MTKEKTEKQAYRSYYYRKNKAELLRKKKEKYWNEKNIANDSH